MTRLDEHHLLLDRYRVYEDARPVSRRADRDELWFFETSSCRSLLESRDLSSRRVGLATRVEQAGFPALGAFFRQWLMYTDGEDHARRRTAVLRALREIGAVDVEPPAIVIGSQFDLIRDFCEPYVWHVLPQSLGLSSDERDFWKPRIDQLVALPGSENPQVHIMRQAQISLQELHEFLLARPCKLLSILQRNIDPATDAASIVNLAINIIGDGIHPTIAGLGSEIFLRLTSQSTSRGGSTDLAFHREPPFQFAARIANAATTVGDVPVKEGQRVVACLAAANRAQYTAGTISQPMTFGHGRHACVGRVHAEKCIQSGLSMFANLTEGKARIAGDPQWVHSIGYRMIEALKIEKAAE